MRRRRTMRGVPGRILVGIVAAIVLFAGAVAVQAGRGDDLQDQADALESGLRDVAATEEAVTLELFALESAFNRAAERLGELDARAARVNEATELAREQTQIARRAVETAQSNLAERIRTLYVTDDVDSLDVLIGANSIQDAVDGIGAIERTATHDQQLLDQVADARGRAIEQRDELELRQRQVDQLVTDARSAQRNLAARHADRAAFLRSLRRDLKLGRKDVAELRQRAVALEVRAAELAAEARLASETAAAEPSATGSTPAEASPASPPPTEPALPSAPASPPPTNPPPAAPPAPAGGPGAGSQMTVVATAYAIHGTTAVGVQTQPGIVAVDPQVIPLGAKMSIPGYGDGVAADTGSAVKGAIIDVWFATVEEALAWGTRTVTITFR